MRRYFVKQLIWCFFCDCEACIVQHWLKFSKKKNSQRWVKQLLNIISQRYFQCLICSFARFICLRMISYEIQHKYIQFSEQRTSQTDRNFRFLSDMIIFEISQFCRCDFFNKWIVEFFVIYVNFSEYNIIRFVNLSVIDKTQSISFFVFDSSSTKFIVIIWKRIEEKCMSWKFSHNLWRLI